MIYFIQEGESGSIKIEFTTNIEERLHTLQTASAHPLQLIGAMTGTLQTEKRIHQEFAHLRIRGEWFSPDPALLDFIKTGIHVQAQTVAPAPSKIQAPPRIRPPLRTSDLYAPNHNNVRRTIKRRHRIWLLFNWALTTSVYVTYILPIYYPHLNYLTKGFFIMLSMFAFVTLDEALNRIEGIRYPRI